VVLYNYRSKIEILQAILEYVDKEGMAKKIHVLYATNLNTKKHRETPQLSDQDKSN